MKTVANLRIGLDIDQVLADFNGHYLKRFGKWPSKDWAITRNVNHILKNEKAFWLTLPVLNRPNFKPHLYCSSRVNKKVWTKTYLNNNNFPNSRLYQVNGYGISKYPVLKGRVDIFIDDSIFNFEDLNNKGILCLLMTTEENKDYDAKGKRVNNLDIEQITNLYENFRN